MKLVYLYVIGILIVIGAAVAPLVVKQNFTKTLDNKKEILLKQGLELTIKGEEGYIDGKTSFTLKIVDSKKFINYVLNKITTANPDFGYMSEMFKKRGEKDIGLILDGTTFDGFIRHSNLYLVNPEIELSLVRFSDEIMSKMEKEVKVGNIISPLLKEKILTFFINVNSEQKITQIKSKDIDRIVKLKSGKILDFKLSGNKLKIDNKDRIVGIYAFDNQFFGVDAGYKKLLFKTQGFSYKFDYANQFNSMVDMHIDSFKMDNKRLAKSIMLEFKNFNIKSKIKSNNVDTVDIDVSYGLNDLYVKSRKKELRLGKLKLDIEVLDVSKQDLINLSETYNKITLSGKQISSQDIKILNNNFLKIINKGFKTNIVLSISELKDRFIMLNNIKIVLNSKLGPNMAKMGKKGVAELFNALSIDGSVAMKDRDLKTISSLNRKFSKLAKFAKKKANEAIFNIEFKQGKLLANKKYL